MIPKSSSGTRLAVVVLGQTRDLTARRHGGFGQWFSAAVFHARPGVAVTIVEVSDATAAYLSELDGVILSGAYEGVYDPLPWRKRFDEELRTLLESGPPLLAVCFGHQYLAALLGGRVEYSPGREEFGPCTVELLPAAAGDPLFAAMPRSFSAFQSHHDMVVRLPDGASLLAGSDAVPVQAFRWGGRAWGVQFHPEFTSEIMATILEDMEARAIEKGNRQRAGAYAAARRLEFSDNDGCVVLERFVDFCGPS